MPLATGAVALSRRQKKIGPAPHSGTDLLEGERPIKAISGCPPTNSPAKYKPVLTRTLQLRALGGTVAAVARLVGMRTAREYLELASHCESEAAKAQDKFSRYQLLSFAESYRMPAESAAMVDRSSNALETIRHAPKDTRRLNLR